MNFVRALVRKNKFRGSSQKTNQQKNKPKKLRYLFYRKMQFFNELLIKSPSNPNPNPNRKPLKYDLFSRAKINIDSAFEIFKSCS